MPLTTNRRMEKEDYQKFTNMGQVYLFRIHHQEYGFAIVQALEILVNPVNYPLVFHCAAGKDRSGLLAAFVLSIAGVADNDIVYDYALSSQHMRLFYDRMSKDPNVTQGVLNLPDYTWEATPESMEWFLHSLKQEYGSAREYLEIHGASSILFNQLERVLLV